jgi:hypothetical protein
MVIGLIALAAFWLAGIFPVPIGAQQARAEAMIACVVLSVPWYLFWITRLRSMSSADRISSTVLAFFVSGAIAYELLFRRVPQYNPKAWLMGLACLPASYFLTRRLWRSSPSPQRTASNSSPQARPTARGRFSQPWKLAGWLAVGLLALVLAVPVIGVIAVLIPAYQAAQSRDDMRSRMANWGHLTMTFDEDLPITDILIDGAPCGATDISPVERPCSPGSHTVTVVYAHGERKRSVRAAVELAPNEKKTLDLTPLVERDLQERKKRKQPPEATD